MLGGGVYVTQNKVLPGSYVNFVSAIKDTSTLGDRGVVAIALPLGKFVGKVIEVNRNDFTKKATELVGYESTADEVIALREIFCNATKAYVYDIGVETEYTVEDVCLALEPYDFNILCAYTEDAETITTYIAQIKSWRDEIGKKCQLVVYNQTTPNYEGVINVVSTVEDEGAPAHALLAWVAGAEAGCAVNASCTNKIYDGEYTVVVNKSQKDLEKCIEDGQLVFHNVYGDIRVLEDINSLTETSLEKGEDFKNNQTIRVIDQIANDIAKIFNTKYLGKIQNNASGRVSLWADIVSHHRQLEEIQAIENFQSTLLTVEQGSDKKSVVVNDVITVINSMSQLYMTVVVQ